MMFALEHRELKPSVHKRAPFLDQKSLNTGKLGSEVKQAVSSSEAPIPGSTIVRIADLIRRLRLLIASRGSHFGEGVKCNAAGELTTVQPMRG